MHYSAAVYVVAVVGFELVLTASQKGLMTPPGIAYAIVNARAEEAAREANSASPYWDWQKRLDPELYYQRFFGTAPTHLLFAQRAALDMINEEGIENIWKRHQVFARAIWAAVEHWGQEGPVRLNIAEPEQRSHAVTTLHAKGQNLNKLRRWCDTQAGLTLGLGLGFDDPEFARGASVMRIGHMGHMNPPMLLGALAVIEAGMQAVGIPHRPGGVERAAGVIASARD